jgi:hypothetical protein
MKNKEKFSTIKMVEMAILMALVVVLQSISSFGVITICLCLVPITLGAMVLDWKGGATLGFAFGMVALFWGIVGKDVFTLYLFQANWFMTVLICVVKGTMAGLVPGIVYTLLKRLNPIFASVVASITAPVVNTGIFAVGCLLIKEDVISVAGSLGVGADNFITLLFGVLITTNFFVELAINLIFSPALYKVTEIVGKGNKKK